MRRTAAMLMALACFAAPARTEPLPPEGYVEQPPEIIWEEPQLEPQPEPTEQPVAAWEPDPGRPLQITSAWFESSELYVTPRTQAKVNLTVSGLQSGVTYTVDIRLTPRGNKYAGSPEAGAQETFTAMEPKWTGQVTVDMTSEDYIGVPYSLMVSVTGSDGQYAELRQSSAPLTIVPPQIKVTLSQEARASESDPVVLDAQTNVRDIEQGGDYTVRTTLEYTDTKQPVIVDGEVCEREQVLEAPEGYLKTYAVLASFPVPERLILGRSLRARVRLFRDGLEIGAARTSAPFFIQDMEGNMPVVTATKTPEQEQAEFEALSQEEKDAIAQEEAQQQMMIEQAQQLEREQEEREQMNTIISFAVLGGILLALWIWWRRRNRQEGVRYR